MAEPLLTAPLARLLGSVLVLYLVGMYALALFARGKIHDHEDFLVAGRRLPLSLAWATLLATWFGAGTLLTAADEVRAGGLQRAALDPLGAGLCLLIAGLFFAAPLWRMGLLTLADFFRREYGPGAELLSALIMVPSYFGWIAAQFTALASLLELFFGLDPRVGILLVAAVGMGYTWLGGMWSVTLTDAVQIVLVLVGLVVLAFVALGDLGGGSARAGLERLASETPAPLLEPIPRGSAVALVGWIGVLAVGALGNLPGQDLMQRIFAARSARVARAACLLAGGAYLTLGLVPVGLGLASRLLVPAEIERSILPALAHLFLSPWAAVVFTLAVVSAVLSTIDSAILSPASVLSQNVFERANRGRVSALTLNRAAVVVVTAASVVVAYLGESAYALLEDAYELPLAGLLAPLVLGIHGRRRPQAAAVAAMAVGLGLWLLHYAAGWETFLPPLLGPASAWLPAALSCAAASLTAFLVAAAAAPRAESSAG